jgi:hypothetical protein
MGLRLGVWVGLTVASLAAGAGVAVTDAEAYSIGREAYAYLYPLVTMEMTRRQMTSVSAGRRPGRGPMNTFTHLGAFPGAEAREVVRPNFDTLYSLAWLDLREGPQDRRPHPGQRIRRFRLRPRAPGRLRHRAPGPGRARDFLRLGAELMWANPPHLTDQPILARMKRIRLDPGRAFDPARVRPGIREALLRAVPDARRAQEAKVPTVPWDIAI